MKLLDFRLEFYPTWVLIEGRLEDARKKFPGVAIDQLAEQDPSKNLKYLFWMAKQRQDGEQTDDIVRAVKFFDKNQKRLRHKDISSYSVTSLKEEQEELGASHRQEKKEQKVSGAELVLETPNARVFYIKSKKACMAYGKGTKWCITQADQPYWEDYRSENVEFFFVLKKEPIGDANDKIAFSCYVEQGSLDYFQVFDAEDKELNDSDLVQIYSSQEVREIFKTIEQQVHKMAKEGLDKEIRRLIELGAKSGNLQDVINFMISADPKIEKRADGELELQALADYYFTEQLYKHPTGIDLFLKDAEKVLKQSKIKGFQSAAKLFILKFISPEELVNFVPSSKEEQAIFSTRFYYERGVARLFLNSPNDFLRRISRASVEAEKNSKFEKLTTPVFLNSDNPSTPAFLS